jgi:hypothetical protein
MQLKRGGYCERVIVEPRMPLVFAELEYLLLTSTAVSGIAERILQAMHGAKIYDAPGHI